MGAASTTPRAQASNWALPSSCNLKSTGFGTWGCNVGANGHKNKGLRRVRVRVWPRLGMTMEPPYWNPNPKIRPLSNPARFHPDLPAAVAACRDSSCGCPEYTAAIRPGCGCTCSNGSCVLLAAIEVSCPLGLEHWQWRWRCL